MTAFKIARNILKRFVSPLIGHVVIYDECGNKIYDESDPEAFEAFARRCYERSIGETSE